jgi:hypothetical protein
MNSSTSTHAPAVEAIIPVVLSEVNAALKPRGILLDVQSESADDGSLTVFNATVQGARHQDTMRLTIDPQGAVHARCGTMVMAELPTVATAAELTADEMKKLVMQYVDWIAD